MRNYRVDVRTPDGTIRHYTFTCSSMGDARVMGQAYGYVLSIIPC